MMKVQPVEEMIFDSNSSESYKNPFRHETELKWIKTFQKPLPLRFKTTYITRAIFLKCQILKYFLFWIVGNVQLDIVVIEKTVILKVDIKPKLFGHYKAVFLT